MKADPEQRVSSYRRYSLALLAILLGWGLAIGFAGRSANRHIEAYLVETAGRGLAQSAAALAESLNRLLFEHALQSRTFAQTPLLRGSDSAALAAYAHTMETTLPSYMSVQVTDATGRVIAATDSSQIGRDRSQHVWFQTLRQGRTSDLRAPDLIAHAGHALIFPTPIVGDEGQFLGVVALQVGLQSVQFMLDGARRALAVRPSTARLDYQLVASDGLVLYDSEDREADRRPEVRSLFVSGAKAGYREELHPQRNVAIVTGYAPVNRYGQVPEWQWTLLVRMDREAILTPFHRLVRTMMMWGGIALIAFMAILLWIIGRLKKTSDSAHAAVARTPATPASQGRRVHREVVHGTRDRLVVRKPEPRPEDNPRPPAEIVALNPERWEDLRRWVRLAEVNRVCLFKNHRGQDGELWASRRYEWIGLGEVARAEWSQWFSWSLRAKGFSRWEHSLAEGHAISGAAATFPPAEAAALMSCGIHTVFVVPLFVGEEWWGFVEFDHCFTERVWSDAEQQGLKATADLLQTVIHQPSGEQDLQQVLASIDAVLESTADGILVVDGDSNLVTFNQRLVSMWNMPDAVTESRLTEEIMAWMMRQLKVPDVLLRTMSELGNEPEAESYDILELHDGRMVERLSKPRRDGDRYDGRIWIFRESIALRPTPLSVHSSQ